jgi:hypothetical protein
MNPPTTPKRRPKINARIVEKLKSALDAARAAADPTSTRCAVDPKHREAMRLYLRTWAVWPLESALEAITGEKP